MTGSRAARIWKRTVVGTALAVGAAGLVWASSMEHGAQVVLACGVVCAVWGLVEVHRMPALGDRWMALVALPSVAVVCYVVGRGLDMAPERVRLGSSAYWATLTGCASAVLVTAPLGLLAAPLYRPRVARPDWRGPAILATWIVLPLVGLVLVPTYRGTPGLVGLLVLSKVGDIAGYYVGNAVGQRHPFPRLSPGKTVAGCVGSLVAGVLAGAACQTLGLLGEPRLGLASGLIAGALWNVAAQAGDLFESGIKRTAGVKDSGTTFGPSGGLLDLVDSLLITVPVSLLSWPLLFS